eukprot:4159479-Prymnesium_polylepis.1
MGPPTILGWDRGGATCHIRIAKPQRTLRGRQIGDATQRHPAVAGHAAPHFERCAILGSIRTESHPAVADTAPPNLDRAQRCGLLGYRVRHVWIVISIATLLIWPCS